MRSRDIIESLVEKSEREGELRYRARNRDSLYREDESGRREFIDLSGEVRLPVRSTHLSVRDSNIGKMYIKVSD